MSRFANLSDWLAWQEHLHPRHIDLGLDRVRQVFSQLCPDYRKPLTLTIAGTNGKGSCAAFLESILMAAGYRVGVYTSPHLVHYNERIRINGTLASDDKIIGAFEQIEAVRHDISLSYFEFGTLAALKIFSSADVDVQILEVGMGGRLDAVNIIDTDLALITSIGIDHAEWLGPTRDLIAREKAGIFRTGTPVVSAEMNPPNSLLEAAKSLDSPYYQLGCAFNFQRGQDCWHWQDPNLNYDNLSCPGLDGDHQYRNSASVIMALRCLEDRLKVSKAAINQGLEQVTLNGRIQLRNDRVPVLLDVGHNPQAAQTLFEHLVSQHKDKRIHAVFTMMKDKDIMGVIEILKPAIYRWYYAPLPANPRCANRALMEQAFNHCQVGKAFLDAKDFAEAMNAAKSHFKKNDLLVVFGSFFLVSEYLRANP